MENCLGYKVDRSVVQVSQFMRCPGKKTYGGPGLGRSHKAEGILKAVVKFGVSISDIR